MGFGFSFGYPGSLHTGSVLTTNGYASGFYPGSPIDLWITGYMATHGGQSPPGRFLWIQLGGHYIDMFGRH